MDEVKKRIVEDTLDVQGRKFKVKKFDPLLGNYIVVKVLGMIMPGVGKKQGEDEEGGEHFFTNVLSSLSSSMSKKEFIEFQRDILSNAYEILPGDMPPVIRDNGTVGIENFTSAMAMQLMIAVLAFNFADFFEEGGLLGQTMSPASSPLDMKTSTKGFTSL